MNNPGQYLPLRREEQHPRSAWLAPLSIVAGSCVTLLPLIASVPFLPPFGLLMMLGWRLHKPELFQPWSAVPLGLFDDLVSGQPLGSAMMLWTLCFLAIDVIDTRIVWRDFFQDWLIAAGAVGFCLIAGRLVASSFGAHVDTALLAQIALCIALFPPIVRMCAWLDRERDRR